MTKAKKASKEKKPSNETSETSKKKKVGLQRLLEADPEIINDVLSLIKKIGASAIHTIISSGSFKVGIDIEVIDIEKDNFPKLKDLDVQKVFSYIGGLIYSIHLSEIHNRNIEKELKKVILKNKEKLFKALIKKIKSHDAYIEIIFIIEPFGQRLDGIKGRKLSVEKDTIVLEIYEINLTYRDFNDEKKSISLELNLVQMEKLISDLQELLGE